MPADCAPAPGLDGNGWAGFVIGAGAAGTAFDRLQISRTTMGAPWVGIEIAGVVREAVFSELLPSEARQVFDRQLV